MPVPVPYLAYEIVKLKLQGIRYTGAFGSKGCLGMGRFWRKILFFQNIRKLYMNLFGIKGRFRIWIFFRKIFTPRGPRPGFFKDRFLRLGPLDEKILKSDFRFGFSTTEYPLWDILFVKITPFSYFPVKFRSRSTEFLGFQGSVTPPTYPLDKNEYDFRHQHI